MWESERCVILLGLVDAFLEALYELLPASVVRRLVVGLVGYCKIPVGDMDENDQSLPGRMLRMSISGYRVGIDESVSSHIDFEILTLAIEMLSIVWRKPQQVKRYYNLAEEEATMSTLRGQNNESRRLR